MLTSAHGMVLRKTLCPHPRGGDGRGTLSLLEKQGITSRSCDPLSEKERQRPPSLHFCIFSQFLSFGFKYQILVAQTDPAFHHQLPRVVKGVTCLFLGKPLSTWDEQLTLSRVLTFVFRPFYWLDWPLIAFYRMIDWNMKQIVTSSCLPRQYYNRLSSNLKCKRWDIELKWFTDYIWCWRPCSFFIFYCLSLSLNRLYILIFQS